MHTYVRRALQTALVSGGLLATAAVAAQATPHVGALGVDAVVGSTTEVLVDLGLEPEGEPAQAHDHPPLVSAPVTVPVGVSDVAVAVLGDATVVPDRGAGGGGTGGADGGRVGVASAETATAGQVGLARSTGRVGASVPLDARASEARDGEARATEVRPRVALADTGSELWLVPVALLLVVGGVWLRGRAHRAAARHPGRVGFVPHQRGASDGS